MTFHGTVQNGIVVLDGNPAIPDGTEVSVEVAPAAVKSAAPDRMTEEERLRVLAILDRIAALPIEGTAEPFSGADHDKVLYGAP
ncbi:MAG: hypothetical protein ACR2FY_12805 [Pirellulaceae bacterium]